MPHHHDQEPKIHTRLSLASRLDNSDSQKRWTEDNLVGNKHPTRWNRRPDHECPAARAVGKHAMR